MIASTRTSYGSSLALNTIFAIAGLNPLTNEIYDSIIYADIESEGTINPPFKIPKDLQIGLKTLDFIDKISMKGIDDKDYTPLYTIGEED